MSLAIVIEIVLVIEIALVVEIALVIAIEFQLLVLKDKKIAITLVFYPSLSVT